MWAFSDRKLKTRPAVGGRTLAGELREEFLAVRTAATAHDTNPEHLGGLLPLAYLAAWAPYFLMTSQTRGQACARFLLSTASILACVGFFELLGIVGAVDYRQIFSTPTPPWRRPGNRPDPELLYVKEGTLVAQRFDPSALKITGEPVPLAEQMGGSPSSQSPARGFNIQAAVLCCCR